MSRRTALDLFELFAHSQPAPTDKKVRALLGGKEPESSVQGAESKEVKEVSSPGKSGVYSLKGGGSGGVSAGTSKGPAASKSKHTPNAKSQPKSGKSAAKK